MRPFQASRCNLCKEPFCILDEHLLRTEVLLLALSIMKKQRFFHDCEKSNQL